MSTKTTFKRVALVAVAALGLGVMTVAPSQAAPVSLTLTPSALTAATTTSETATISIGFSSVIGAETDSLTVNAVVTSANVATKGTLNFAPTTDSGTTTVFTSSGVTANKFDISATPGTAVGGQIRGTITLSMVKPSAAGTYSVLVYTTSGGSVTAADKQFVWTVTVTAPSTNADASSTSWLGSGRWTAIADPVVDTVINAPKSAGNTIPSATIKVNQKNATSSASEAMVVSITGPGYIRNNTGETNTTNPATARVLTIAAPTAGASSFIGVYADGQSGVATVTIIAATSGTVIGSETVTFSDTKPATVAATVVKSYIKAGATTSDVFAVTVKDASGNAITNTSAVVTGTRSDTTTAGKAIATADLSCTWNVPGAAYHCSATGASATGFGPASYTITVTGTDQATAALSTKLTTTATTTFSDVVATKVTVTAPATASVGDKITYTLTATEKNGYPVADGTYEHNNAAAVGGIFWNTTATKVPVYSSATIKPFNAGESITTKSGVATVDLFMPVAAGNVAATWTLAGSATAPVGAIDKSIAGTVITVSTAVTNAGVEAATDAANEATDAANAATDAALAAAEAADAATSAAQEASDAVAALSESVTQLIAGLQSQIKALAKVVNKIAKQTKK